MADEQFMRIAIEEAKKGLGRTSPNPLVGAVIVKDGRIIGKGYHKKAGTAHAEINAMKNAGEDLVGSTIYVTLEPCSHTGRTGPCCEAIAAAGISRVVVGMTDPNPLVNGRGISYLINRGISVASGILEKECEDFNQPFIKYITTSLPYMVMKAGVSLDGRLNYQWGMQGRITGDESRIKVHQLRDHLDAILVGSGTIVADDPLLTTRLVGSDHKDPVPVVVDTGLNTPLSSKVYTRGKSIVICSKNAELNRKKAFEKAGVTLIEVEERENRVDLQSGLLKVAELGIISALVEGGSRIHASFLEAGLYDYAYLFYAPIFAGSSGQSLVDGMDVRSREMAPKLLNPVYEKIGEDMIVSGKVHYPESQL